MANPDTVVIDGSTLHIYVTAGHCFAYVGLAPVKLHSLGNVVRDAIHDNECDLTGCGCTYDLNGERW